MEHPRVARLRRLSDIVFFVWSHLAAHDIGLSCPMRLFFIRRMYDILPPMFLLNMLVFYHMPQVRVALYTISVEFEPHDPAT